MEKSSSERGKEVKTRVFVYGSLLSGLGNNGRLQGQELEGPATTTCSYTLVSLGPFPGMYEDGETSVVGETYLVNASGMRGLNNLEGVNESSPEKGMYRREEVSLDDGSTAIGYIYNGNCSNIVESGNWRQHHANNRRVRY